MFINLHGYVIECIAPTPEFQAELVRPFSLFLSDADEAAITIEVIGIFCAPSRVVKCFGFITSL
jgi:hypothetical protein